MQNKSVFINLLPSPPCDVGALKLQMDCPHATEKTLVFQCWGAALIPSWSGQLLNHIFCFLCLQGSSGNLNKIF